MKKIIVYGLLLFTFFSSKAMERVWISPSERQKGTKPIPKFEPIPTKESTPAKEEKFYYSKNLQNVKVGLGFGCLAGAVVLGGMYFGNGGSLPPASHCIGPVVRSMGAGLVLGATVSYAQQQITSP